MTSTGDRLDDDCNSAMDYDVDDDDDSATGDDLETARRATTMMPSAQRSTTTTTMATGQWATKLTMLATARRS